MLSKIYGISEYQRSHLNRNEVMWLDEFLHTDLRIATLHYMSILSICQEYRVELRRYFYVAKDTTHICKYSIIHTSYAGLVKPPYPQAGTVTSYASRRMSIIN